MTSLPTLKVVIADNLAAPYLETSAATGEGVAALFERLAAQAAAK